MQSVCKWCVVFEVLLEIVAARLENNNFELEILSDPVSAAWAVLEPDCASVRSCSCSQTDEDPGWSWLFVSEDWWDYAISRSCSGGRVKMMGFIQNHGIELTVSISCVVSYSWWVLECFWLPQAAEGRLLLPNAWVDLAGIPMNWTGDGHHFKTCSMYLSSFGAARHLLHLLLYSRKSTMPVKGKYLFGWVFFSKSGLSKASIWYCLILQHFPLFHGIFYKVPLYNLNVSKIFHTPLLLIKWYQRYY